MSHENVSEQGVFQAERLDELVETCPDCPSVQRARRQGVEFKGAQVPCADCGLRSAHHRAIYPLDIKPVFWSQLFSQTATVRFVTRKLGIANANGIKVTQLLPVLFAHNRRGLLARNKVPARILVVEDSPVNQKVISWMIEQAGHTCDVANNGLEALESLKHAPYSLVFIDLRTPVMDGFQTARQIRAAENNVPLIAFTSSPMSDDAERCADAGFTEFIAKPLSKLLLEKLLDRWLKVAS